MPVRTTTYNKSSMLQRDLPNVNFICTDGDGLKFTPSAGDNKVTGLAQNTYHPPESKSVLWNSVKLNWTRQALSNYNLLTQNQSNACEDGTTTGFWSQSSATLTASTTEHYEGSYSLKIVTPGAVSGEGMATYNVKATPGYKYSAKARVKGSGTVVLQLVERDSSGTAITWTLSSTVTLTSSWQEINVSQMFTMGVNVNLKILTSGTQAITFYLDTLQINAGDPAPWVEGPAPDFKVTASLLGLTNSGEESLIGEKIITTCPTTETNEVISFNLLSSACQTQFTRESGTAAPGKIQLNLPKRCSSYESITLNRVWADGFNKRNMAVVTGSINGTLTNYPIPVTINYDSDMKSDFSDVWFYDADSRTPLNYYLVSKTDGITANFYVKVPEIPQNPGSKNIYAFYGNLNATSQSNGFNTFTSFDNFEDGSYGRYYTDVTPVRSAPYNDWLRRGGTATIESISPINGQYSIKHTGDGTDTIYNRLHRYPTGLSHMISFKFRCTNQGTLTNTPYVWLWILRYNGANDFIALRTYYYSSTGKQLLQLYKIEGGSASLIQSIDWLTGKLGTSTTYQFKIIDTGSVIKVYVDNVEKLNASYSTTVPANVTTGFGANLNTTGMWDDICYYIPNIANISPPTTSSWVSEESTQTLTPDSANPDDTRINFTAPYDWSTNSYAYLNFKEYDNFNITTRSIPLSVQNIAQLGYNGLDAFNALRLKIESECNDDYTFKFNNFKFRYII